MTDTEQRQRFEEMARKLECDESEARFNANLKKIAESPKAGEKPKD